MIVDLNKKDKKEDYKAEIETGYVTREEFNHKIKILESKIKMLESKLNSLDDGWSNK